MARMKKSPEAPIARLGTPGNSLVASAARISGHNRISDIKRKSTSDEWQMTSWGFYRTIGEFRFGCDWVGSMLSKALIHATLEAPDGTITRIKDGNIVTYISSLFGDADGRAEMFRLIGIHMSVAGECNVISYADPDKFGNGGDLWQVVAPQKVKLTQNNRYTINEVLIDVDAKDVLNIRIWRPDPLEPDLAISPARAVLPILSEIFKLTEHVAAQVDSRLAGAGILLMPSEMTFPTPPVEEGAEIQVANNAEDLMQIITTAMATSITNRGDASALVPIVITAPADAIAAVKHLTFWSELDAHAIELRNEAIRRLALGLDMPPEVLQGSSDSNHWSAWQADESAIKSHTEPLLKIITTALAKGYLRPLISDDSSYNEDELRSYSIKADTSEMRLRPNRSKEALELYALDELSGDALRRETGFDDGDKPDDAEKKLRILQRLASGSATPEQVDAALKMLGVDLQVAPAADGVGGPTPAPAVAQDPSIANAPENSPPDPGVSAKRAKARADGNVPSADIARKAALIAGSEQLVFRALERAGNKLKSKMQVKPTCAAADIYKFVAATDTEFLLDDAWSGVPLIATRAGLSDGWLEMALEDYTTDLLLHQEPHTYDKLSVHLDSRFPREVAA